MKIILIVPDGVAVRNYLYSNFVKELENREFEIHIFHQIPNLAIQEVIQLHPNIKSVTFIDFFTESFFERILRESTVYARILHNIKKFKNGTIILFWNDNKKDFKRIVLFKIAKTLGYLVSKSYPSLLFLERLYDYSIGKRSFTKEIGEKIDAIQPDVAFNLHQRSILAAPFVAHCKKRKITTIAAIFSWDNIPKARLISRYNYYFVWSDLMKNEMKIAYPEINQDTIIVAGTPQFEFYFRDEFKQGKNEFFQKYALDPSKKTICFSSNDISSPYDQVYLNDICEELSQLPTDQIPQIIFRINPFDKSNRFSEVLSKYQHLITEIKPDWRSENTDEKDFVNIFCAYNDVSVLVNTVLHSDLVINLGSTMAHDFAAYDKPCIYLNYDPVENPSLKIDDVYNFQHFRSMKGLDSVFWLNDKNEIAEKIIFALDNPQSVATERTQWLEKIIRHPLESNSSKLAHEITTICTSAT